MAVGSDCSRMAREQVDLKQRINLQLLSTLSTRNWLFDEEYLHRNVLIMQCNNFSNEGGRRRRKRRNLNTLDHCHAFLFLKIQQNSCKKCMMLPSFLFVCHLQLYVFVLFNIM